MMLLGCVGAREGVTGLKDRIRDHATEAQRGRMALDR